MYRGNSVAVVVPAYNEEEFVASVIEMLPSYVDRVYPVDDCSSDDTWAEIRACAAQENEQEAVGIAVDGGERLGRRIVPIRHSENSGRGAAVTTGYRRALDDGADIVAVLDGDGQMDPAALERILDPIVHDEADYVVGNRLDSPDLWDGMPTWRLFGNTVLTLLTRIASGYWTLSDPQNGYTAASAETLSDLDFDRLYDRYGFLNDVLVKLNVAGKRVTNVPIRARYGDEESGIRYSEFVPDLSWLLLRNFLWRLRENYLTGRVHPAAVLYIGGAIVSTVGLVQGTRSAVSDEVDLRQALFALFAGVGSLLGAMVSDKRENEDRSP
jgi:glycosyltransferase involved in cell wall biosynthesis